jgi:hypothetical protein
MSCFEDSSRQTSGLPGSRSSRSAFARESERELAALWMRHRGSRSGGDVRRTGRRLGAGLSDATHPARGCDGCRRAHGRRRARQMWFRASWHWSTLLKGTDKEMRICLSVGAFDQNAEAVTYNGLNRQRRRLSRSSMVWKSTTADRSWSSLRYRAT